LTTKNGPIICDISEMVQDRRFTHKKRHTGFLLVPRLVTSNAFKLHNGHYFCYSPNLVPLLANYVTLEEVIPIRSGTVM